MGRIHISKLLPGMVLEADVYNEADQLILPEGLKLTDKAIQKLTYYGIEVVRIENEVDQLPEEEAPAQQSSPAQQSAPAAEETYSERLKKTEEFKVFKENFENAVNDVQGFLSDVVEKNLPPDTTNIMNSIQEMLHPPGGDIVNVFDMIHNMRALMI